DFSPLKVRRVIQQRINNPEQRIAGKRLRHCGSGRRWRNSLLVFRCSHREMRWLKCCTQGVQTVERCFENRKAVAEECKKIPLLLISLGRRRTRADRTQSSRQCTFKLGNSGEAIRDSVPGASKMFVKVFVAASQGHRL